MTNNTVTCAGVSSMANTTDAYISTDYSSISRNIKLSAENFDRDELKRLITEILLEDPDSEVKKIAEDYLIQVLYHATDDPEFNPIISKFMTDNRTQLANLRTDLDNLKLELENLKYNLMYGSSLDGGSYCSYDNTRGVMWKSQYGPTVDFLNAKVCEIEAKLRDLGIGEENWAN